MENGHETIIHRKKAGTFRVNSLYYFALDHLDQILFDGWTTSVKQNSREVIYFKPSAGEAQKYALNAIFPGFDYAPESSHLSVDKEIINPQVIASNHRCPAHSTLVFRNLTTHEHKIAHIHYDISGKVILVVVTHYKNQNDAIARQNGEQGEVTQTIAQQLQTVASPYLKFLKHMIKAKNEKYMELYKKVESLDVELASAHHSKDHIKELALGQSMEQTLEKLSNYDDEKTDGRLNFLRSRIARLTDPKALTNESGQDFETNEISPSDSSSNPAMVVNRSSVKQSKPVRVSKAHARTAKMQRDVDSLIEKMLAHEPQTETAVLSAANYMDHWQQLDWLAQFESSSSLKRHIKARRQALLIPQEMLSYFNACVEQNNFEKVALLYPFVVQFNDLMPFFDTLCVEFFLGTKLIPSERLQIIEFMYNNSSIFNTHMAVMHSALAGGEEMTFGVLLRSYSLNDLERFKLALRTGASVTEMQLVYSQTNHAFDALKAIILNYEVNDGPQKIEFIRELFKYGASTKNHINYQRDYRTANLENGRVSTLSRPHFFISRSREQRFTLLSHHIQGLAYIEDAFLLYCELFPGKNIELLQELIPYIELDTLLMKLGEQCNQKNILHRLVLGNHGPGIACFENKASCDEHTVVSTGFGFSIYFYPIAENSTFNLLKSLVSILTNKFSGHESWRDTMNELVQSATNAFRNKNYMQSINYLCVAKIAYCSIANPTSDDYLAMLKLLFLNDMVNNAYRASIGMPPDASNCNNAQQSLGLLANFCPVEYQQIENSPIVASIYNYCSRNPNNNSNVLSGFSLFRRAIAASEHRQEITNSNESADLV